MEAIIYNQEGKDAGKVKLPEAVFGAKWNGDLVHQVAVGMMANARKPVAHAKNRGEVSGGGKKPWQQKGTGRARHGSTRSPIWVGGGVTHGPRNDKSYEQKINRKMRVKALYSVLSKKLKDNEVVFIESVELKEAKTKFAKGIFVKLGAVKGLERLSSRTKNLAHVIYSSKSETIGRSFRNIGNVTAEHIKDFNVLDALNHKYLVIADPEKSIEFLAGKMKK